MKKQNSNQIVKVVKMLVLFKTFDDSITSFNFFSSPVKL